MIVKGFDATGEGRIWEDVTFKAVRPGDCIYLDGRRHQVVAVDDNLVVYAYRTFSGRVGRPMPIALTGNEQKPSTLRHSATPEGNQMTEKQAHTRTTAVLESEELGRLTADVRRIIDYVEELRARPVVPQATAEQLAALHHETARLRRRVSRLEDDERYHTHDGHSRTILNGIYCEPNGLVTRYWLRRPGQWLPLWPYSLTGEPSNPVYRLTEDKRHAGRQ